MLGKPEPLLKMSGKQKLSPPERPLHVSRKGFSAVSLKLLSPSVHCPAPTHKLLPW